MNVCIINHKGKVKVHQNIKTDPEPYFELIYPYLNDIVVGVECIFCWYQDSLKLRPDKLASLLLYSAPHSLYPRPCIIHARDGRGSLSKFNFPIHGRSFSSTSEDHIDVMDCLIIILRYHEKFYHTA